MCLLFFFFFFFFNDTATTEIYTLSLHDALPISGTRTDRSPSPKRLTPRCRFSSRLSRRRMMGNTPTATATPTRPNSHRKPKGGRSQKAAAPSCGGRAPRGGGGAPGRQVGWAARGSENTHPEPP